MVSRAEQKQKTRRAIINAALAQLSPSRSFAALSLREVAREAGIAPTSFYRHFKDMDELGLTLVDEAGLALRQLMRHARQRFEDGGSVIRISVETFMEYVAQNPNVFRLLLRERSGTAPAFRAAVAREIQHFIEELRDYLRDHTGCPKRHAQIQAEAMVTLVFGAGAELLDLDCQQQADLVERVIRQLKFVARGAASYQKPD